MRSSVFHLPSSLSSLSADPPGELDVLRHDGHPLGVDGAQVGVLEQADQVGLGSLLKSVIRDDIRISARGKLVLLAYLLSVSPPLPPPSH